jgi:hypothetical protein
MLELREWLLNIMDEDEIAGQSRIREIFSNSNFVSVVTIDYQWGYKASL